MLHVGTQSFRGSVGGGAAVAGVGALARVRRVGNHEHRADADQEAIRGDSRE